MSQFHLDEVIQATNGKIISRHQEIFDGVGSDTRLNLDKQIFIALKGDQFDAHQFLSKAQEQGAAALIVHQMTPDTELLKQKVTIIHVDDTLLALQNLARYYRVRNGTQVIGIAGSNGKTTSKEFSAAVLSAFRNVHYSKGSFNNHWGVPFTLLAQPEGAEVSVVEMGMNHEKELEVLVKIALPNIVVCTYVGVEHIEYFGTLQKIADAEEEVYEFAPPKATRIYNIDNEYTFKMYEKAKLRFPEAKLMTFSEHKKADVQMKIQSATMSEMTLIGQIGDTSGTAIIPVFGRHNVTNVMVAAAVTLAAGVSAEEIWQALPRCQTNWGRNQLVQTAKGMEILFDGYNSNPDSMRALVSNMQLIQVSGKKIGIFAEMKELGALSAKLHEETGQVVATSGLDEVWFYGEHCQDFKNGIMKSGYKGHLHVSTDFDEELAKQIISRLKKNDIVLVKGSRSMKLERFVKLCEPVDFNSY